MLQTEKFLLRDLVVDPVSGTITSPDGNCVRLTSRVMEVLCLLASRGGELVTRNELVDAIWAGNHPVGDKGVSNAIWTLRRELRDSKDEPRYVQTVPRKGYRCVAEVRSLKRAGSGSIDDAAGRWSGWRSALRFAGPRALLAIVSVGLLLLVARWLVVDSDDISSSHQFGLDLIGVVNPGAPYTGLGRFSPDGRYLAMIVREADQPETVRIVQADSRDEVGNLFQTAGFTLDLAWSPSSERMAVSVSEGDIDCEVRIYRIATLQSDQRASYDRVDDCYGGLEGGLSWKGDHLAYPKSMNGESFGVFQFNLATATGDFVYLPSVGQAHSVAHAPNDPRMAFVHTDRAALGRISIVDSSGKIQLFGESAEYAGIAWTGDAIALAGYRDAVNELVLIDTLRLASRPVTVPVPDRFVGGQVLYPHYSPARNALLTQIYREKYRLMRVDLASGSVHQDLSHPIVSYRHSSFADAGARFFFSDAHGNGMELWKQQGAQPAAVLTDNLKWPRFSVPSPAGTRVAFMDDCLDDFGEMEVCVYDESGVQGIAAVGAPSSWIDEDRLLFMQFEGDVYGLRVYDFRRSTHSEFVVNDAYHGYFDDSTGGYFYFADGKIWQAGSAATSGSEDPVLLADGLQGRDYRSWLIDDGILFYVARGDAGDELVKLNIATGAREAIAVSPGGIDGRSGLAFDREKQQILFTQREEFGYLLEYRITR